MLTPALYVLALFLGLSLVVGVLVAVHDGIEYLLARRARAAGGPAAGSRAAGRAATGRTATGRTATGRTATGRATTGNTAAAHAYSGRAVKARDLVVVSTESGMAPAPSVYQALASQARVHQDQTGRERPAWLEAAGRDLANVNRPTQRPVRAADRRPRNRRVAQGETATREIPTREASRLTRNASGR